MFRCPFSITAFYGSPHRPEANFRGLARIKQAALHRGKVRNRRNFTLFNGAVLFPGLQTQRASVQNPRRAQTSTSIGKQRFCAFVQFGGNSGDPRGLGLCCMRRSVKCKSSADIKTRLPDGRQGRLKLQNHQPQLKGQGPKTLKTPKNNLFPRRGQVTWQTCCRKKAATTGDTRSQELDMRSQEQARRAVPTTAKPTPGARTRSNEHQARLARTATKHMTKPRSIPHHLCEG